MPKIKISEQEAITFASFDATENTVMVPIVYVKDTTETTVPAPKVFSNPSLFKSAFRSKCSYLDANSEGVGINLDRTYFMIYELLLQGLSVLVVPIDSGKTKSGNDNVIISEDEQVKYISNFVDSVEFDKFKDRNTYNIKFITSGGYANLFVGDDSIGTYSKLVDLAERRGDAIALLELPQDVTDIEQLARATAGISGVTLKFAAMTFPWCTFTTTAENIISKVTMPASFAYLMAYANSVKTNSNWFAAAGTIRGSIPNLIEPKVNVGEAFMHYLQNDGEYANEYIDSDEPLSLSLNINPVYNAGAYGYRIWGNKVAWKKSVSEANQYMEYLNVRILMCDIKKQVFHAAMRTTFEPNDDIVWYNFKSLANSLLDRMKSGRGIRWYKWTKEETNEKALIKATITIQPIEAVESFDINIILTDQDATVLEEEE